MNVVKKDLLRCPEGEGRGKGREGRGRERKPHGMESRG